MNDGRGELLEQMKGRRVLVVGDVMLDEYVFGDVQRISPDAPVPVVSFQRREQQLGGAGNVAKNLKALGAHPVLVAGIGPDLEGARVKELACELGLESQLVVLEGRPTTHKLRVVGRNQHVVRLDREQPCPIDEATCEQVLRRVTCGPVPAAIILSDYAKGLLAPRVIAGVMDWAEAHEVPVLVDPKCPDFRVYRGARFLTPNAAEALAATGIATTTREGAVAACQKMLADSGAAGVLLTRGEQGMALVTPDSQSFIAAHTRKVFDVTGAGDTVVATFALCLAAGAGPEEAMALANHAASVVVGKLGAATCSWEELAREVGPVTGPVHHLLSLSGAQDFAAQCRGAGRRIAFTNGCFDVLHAGHVVLLEEAKARGDALIVGLNSDASVSRLKGPTRPVQPLHDRARLLCALRMVDAVVAFDEDTPLRTILALRPDVLVKGGDYSFETIVGASEVTGWGGEVAVVPTLAMRSTTRLLARAAAPERLTAAPSSEPPQDGQRTQVRRSGQDLLS